MTLRVNAVSIVSAALALFAAGCAQDSNLSTASINGAAPVKTAAAVDPACTALASQIDTLRKEGAIEGLEKAATGKGASVKVKREALSKQAELNRVNADFQSKCGPKIPVQQAAAQPAPAAAVPPPASQSAQAPTSQVQTSAQTAQPQAAPAATAKAAELAPAAATAAKKAATP